MIKNKSEWSGLIEIKMESWRNSDGKYLSFIIWPTL